MDFLKKIDWMQVGITVAVVYALKKFMPRHF